MSFILKLPKIDSLIAGFTVIGLTMLACSSGSQSADGRIVMLTRLPTLTPTVMGGVVNAAAPVEAAAQPAPAEATAVPAPVEGAAQPAPVEAAAPPALQPAPVEATPAPVEGAAAQPAPSIVIAALNKVEEYVDLQNVSDQPQDLRGWNVLSEKDGQKCNLAGTIAPGETLRIWALATQAAQGGYNCGFSQEIWSDNEADDAILYDAFGVEVSRAK